jgi:Delta24-sterol reductase
MQTVYRIHNLCYWLFGSTSFLSCIVPSKVKQGKPWDPKVNVRAMEHWTRDVGGWQAPYTDLFCTHKEFRQMFNHTLWDKQRIALKCEDAFPTVYDKVRPERGIVDLSDIVQAEEREKK